MKLLIRDRLVKVVATFGPSLYDILKSDPLSALKYIDVIRFNFSHINTEEDFKKVREAMIISRRAKPQVAFLADLQGPKIRVGDLEDKLELRKGDRVILTLSNSPKGSDKPVIPIPHKEVFEALREGIYLFINDGKVRLKITRVTAPGEAEAIVEVGGIVKRNKGVNLPGIHLPIAPLTPKDLEDLKWIAKSDFQMVAMSFVQREEDIQLLRDKIKEFSTYSNLPIVIAKIETLRAIDNLSRITSSADALMIARGDLAVEASYEEIPLLQKELISTARAKGKPVIVATQVLSSMVNSPYPTRAELTDIANAILDGADAIMLSEETAVGRYPLQVLDVLHKVSSKTETYKNFSLEISDYMPKTAKGSSDAIANALLRIYDEVRNNQEVIIAVYSTKAKLFEAIARARPQATIFLFSPDPRILKIGMLTWGTVTLEESFSNAWEFELYLGKELKRSLSPGKKVKIIGVYRDNHLFII